MDMKHKCIVGVVVDVLACSAQYTLLCYKDTEQHGLFCSSFGRLKTRWLVNKTRNQNNKVH